MEELKAAEAKLNENLRKLRKVIKAQTSQPSSYDERTAQRDLMRKRRAEAKDIVIPEAADKARRAACEADLLLGLKTYFGDIFYQPWNMQRTAMVEAIEHAALYGGDQAIAAPRGEGKTSIVECAIILLVLRGSVRFPLITAATGPDAQRILNNIKGQLERNDLLNADYPEACTPIRELEGAPQRANSQTVKGKRTHIKWHQDYVQLPTIDGFQGSGAVFMTRGLDASIRGIRVNNLRPDLVVIDDPETRESVESEVQIDKRSKTIDQDLAGLGGPGKKLSRIMLTTIMKRECLSDIYTDVKRRSGWHGKRFRLVETWPERLDLVDEYIQRRQQNQQDGDPTAREAHAFYVENREKIEQGSVVPNSARFLADTLDDGTQVEVSTFQSALNFIADNGRDAFDCELQNDPPKDRGLMESSITAARVQRQVSGYPRNVVPPEVVLITQGIDVKKVALHYVVRAWRADGTGFTIDYGVHDIEGTFQLDDQGVDMKIYRAIVNRFQNTKDTHYTTVGGELVDCALTVVDAGWRTDAVYHACREIGVGIVPAMGYGKSAGCASPNFSQSQEQTPTRIPGDGWFFKKRDESIWLLNMDSDRWKAWEHDRWMTAPGKPGCMYLFGEDSEDGRTLTEDQKNHFAYSKNITAEIEVEEVKRGVLVKGWKTKSTNNHYFDASYMADVAASVKGIRVIRTGPMTPPPQQPRVEQSRSPFDDGDEFLASNR